MADATLYPKNATPTLDMKLFAAPTAEYRGTPFWSWNGKLDIPTLKWQLDALGEMGLGGAHMHTRVGLATEYLGTEYMAAVKACVAHAKSRGMLAWLYDEDRWPSGAAGGLVTKDPQYRMHYLLFTPRSYDDDARSANVRLRGQGRRTGGGTPLARYWVKVQNGALAEYRRLKEGENPAGEGRAWYAYLEPQAPSTWYNRQTYLDTLSRPAVEKFIEVTHERYLQAVGDEFGKTVPAIFTDEPQFTPLSSHATPESTDDRQLSWTHDFAETYRQQYGEDILDFLPELFWQLPGGKPSRARFRYHDHNAERFVSAFSDTIGQWCEKHNIAYTGHLMAEQTLSSQTRFVGECMRSYRAFQIPGIDLLCDAIELNTAKQTQSVARQDGRPGVLSELYGVTNWDFDFAGHKRQGDWQAAMGITVRVHHLAWYTMEGEAKRDYPAAIGWQSPWYKEYSLVENHFARLNTVLTRGRPVTRVGVIHPIESFWLCFGDLESTRVEREEREAAFEHVTQWLLHGLIDFDFISEALLPRQCPSSPSPGTTGEGRGEGKRLQVGQCAYDVVIVPELRTIRSTTLDRLEKFAAAGGTVLFAGSVPTLVDAEPSDRPAKLAAKCRQIPLTRVALLSAVAEQRQLGVYGRDGGLVPGLLYQMRQDGDRRYLFICNTSRDRGQAGVRIELAGQWKLTQLDTFAGEAKPIAHGHRDGKTIAHADITAAGHVLLCAEPAPAAAAVPAPAQVAQKGIARIECPVGFTLSEPNVLLLDQGEFRLDGGDWEPREEILRIDNLLRKRLDWPLVGGAMAQPWSEPPSPADHRVDLKFEIRCEAPVKAPRLAVERSGDATLTLDGKPVPVRADGSWTDPAIHTVALPDLSAGTHELIVSLAYGRRTSLEWCYLLGEFGVLNRGRHSKIVALPKELTFGDWTRQSLPFYGGNVTYHCTLKVEGDGPLSLHVPYFRAPLLTVAIDGEPVGPVAFPPYRIDLPRLSPGQHKLDITAFGSRINCFGALHNCNPFERWYGPGAYRTDGENWCYEYQLRPCGILIAPRVLAKE